jgi:hypothetical protein
MNIHDEIDSAPVCDLDWVDRWFDASAETSLSYRSLASVEARLGLDALGALALARGLHVLRFSDERGAGLVAVSRHPFDVIC